MNSKRIISSTIVWIAVMLFTVLTTTRAWAIDREELLEEQSEYTTTSDIKHTARYSEVAISLADNSDNDETLYTYNGKTVASVTLTGRTLYKDGSWNTLCLPFSLTVDQIAESLLAGADIRTLSSASFANGTLTLSFEKATEIVAGKPYIVKWKAQTPDHMESPVFHNVTISNTYNPVETAVVSFKGNYSPLVIDAEGDNTKLYLGADDKLYWPTAALTIGSFRTYLQLTGDINMNMGDVDGDGAITVADVTMLVNHLLGTDSDDFIIQNADINGDGAISIADVTTMVNAILSGSSTLNVVVEGADGITFGGPDSSQETIVDPDDATEGDAGNAA